MSKPVELTREQARRLALASQGLGARAFARGLSGVRAAVRQLSYVQIDTISVVERAHHHTLFNRVGGYRREHLDRLLARREVLEYWSHAAAYLPMEDFRFCLPRMRAVASRNRHWFEHDEAMVREILARVRERGEMRASDFEAHTGTRGMWQWGPVKRAIEYLFMEGTLMVTRRDNFQKVYDLPERVLPADIDLSEPGEDEFAGYLVDRFMQAHGIARPQDFGYLRRNVREPIWRAVDARLEDGRLLRATVRGVDAPLLVSGDFAERLSRRASNRARLLSPFDNLVIQRERIRTLFGFDYQLECYVPQGKRRYGYFCLPVLWRGRLVARIDAKADRASGVFLIHRVYPERGLRAVDAFVVALAAALRELAGFNGCRDIETACRRGRGVEPALHRALDQPPVASD